MLSPANKQDLRPSFFRELLTPLAVLIALLLLAWIVGRVADLSGWAFGILVSGAGVVAGLLYLAQTARPATREKIAVGVASARSDDANFSGLHPERVIAVSGHSASNKSRIAAELKRTRPDWAYSSCGRFVREEAEKAGRVGDLLETHNFGIELVEKLGPKAFLDAVLKSAEGPDNATTLIIDDIYHPSVYQALQEHWDHLSFVFVDLPESARRAVARERGLDPDEVDKIERHPLDQLANELKSQYEPIKVEGAASEAEIAERAAELESAIAT